MSEFPFADSADSVEESGDSKKLLLVGGVAAAVLLGGGAFFLTSGGDAEEEAFFVPKRPAKVAPAAAAPKTPAKLPVVFAAPVGRDPFRALYTAPAGAGGPAPAAPAPAAPVTTTPTTAPTTGGSTVVITPSKAPTSGGTTAPQPQQQSQSTIRLKAYDVNTKVGTFVLDGRTTVTGKVNDVLNKKVLIIAIRPDREPGTFFATLKVGDGANFDAHFGQTVVIP